MELLKKNIQLVFLIVIIATFAMAGCTRAETRNPNHLPVFAESLPLAEAGDAAAQYRVGVIYFDGLEDVPVDRDLGLKWMHRSAGGGFAEAQFQLGRIYETGEYVALDLAKAYSYYQGAAKQNHPEGALALGILYLTGRGVAADDLKARDWFEIAAEAGNPHAVFNLAILYEVAPTEQQDLAKALHYYRIAAEQGNPQAIFKTGEMLTRGRGVEPDHAEAARWLTQAAHLDHPEAQWYLGIMYARGRGVEQDHVEALNWYTRSAQQGHAAAQFNLALLLDEGAEGVPPNPLEAYIWYRHAAPHLNELHQQRAEEAIARLEENLTPEEKLKGEELIF